MALAPVALTLMLGLSAFVKAAMPAMRPPPPTGTKMASILSGSDTWGAKYGSQ